MYSINNVLAIQALEIKSMTSEEIHKLLPEIRYDNLIRTIETLIATGVFASPQFEVIDNDI